MPLRFKLETYRWPSGERFCHLLDQVTGLPHQLSLLYCVSRIRNAGKSLAAMQAAYNAIHLLLLHLEEVEIDVEARFREGDYLNAAECERFQSAVQVFMSGGRARLRGRLRSVGPANQYIRLTEIAKYLKWLAVHLSDGLDSNGRHIEIERMYQNILELRPTARRKPFDPEKNAWSTEDDKRLLDLITPGSTLNPFELLGTQFRNFLVIQLMRCTGKRRGEVLNIQVRDINFRQSQLNIVRRSDAREDPRIDQPRVKTRQHTIAISQELVAQLFSYLQHRRAVPGSSKHPYLFVTHKSGPTQGQPMTIGALAEVIRTIRRVDPHLSHLHPHLLRHNFNDSLSKMFDRVGGERNFDEEAKVRANLNGWSEQSEMAQLYGKRFISRKAHAVGLEVQEKLMKAVPAKAISKRKS